MKISPVFLLRCLLLVVVSCSVFFAAKANTKQFVIPVMSESSKGQSESVWKNLVALFDLQETNDNPIEEDSFDESEHPDYTYEEKYSEITIVLTYCLPLSFRENNLSFFSQAEPDYQPRPPKA